MKVIQHTQNNYFTPYKSPLIKAFLCNKSYNNDNVSKHCHTVTTNNSTKTQEKNTTVHTHKHQHSTKYITKQHRDITNARTRTTS